MKKIIFALILTAIFPCIACAANELQPNSVVTAPAAKNIISLDIKGMDVVDAIKMLAARSGMNIVIGKNVVGKVTLFLKDVDVNDAFDIIILANDLAFEKKGDIINVMTQRDYELIYGYRFRDNKKVRIIHLKYAKAGELSKALSQLKSNVGKVIPDEGTNTIVLIDSPDAIQNMVELIAKADVLVETRVFSLNYAQAEKLAPKLQESITKGVGSIKMDERTNKIAITDFPAKLDELAKIIASFDEKTLQVLIDAQLIELKPSDQFQMGVNWNYWIKKYFDAQLAMPINAVGSAALIVGTNKNSVNQVGQYSAAIDILRTIGEVNVLSSPRIMALNNQEAMIHIGLKDAYITSSISQSTTSPNVTSQSVNFVDTGIQLKVTPIISREGFVTMKIKPEVSDSTRTDIISQDQTTQVPIVTTSEAETTVMVKDGVTIVIGGLRKDKRTKTVKKIPVLGDIPGLGFLFRSTDDKTETDDLIILLTPHIMSGEKSFSDFSELPPKDGAVAKMSAGEVVVTKVTSNNGLTGFSYYALIADKVKSNAKSGQSAGKRGEVKIGFTINSSGNLIDGPYILESSNALLNESALNAVKQASPFSPFPNGLDKAKETFKISLDYE